MPPLYIPASEREQSPNISELFPTSLPIYPYPIRRPLYLCGHDSGPLPVNHLNSDPMPLVISRPCRNCHYSITEQLVQDIYNRFESELHNVHMEIEELLALLEPGYDPDLARRKDTLLRQTADIMTLRRAEIKEAWDSFRAIWGLWGFGARVSAERRWAGARERQRQNQREREILMQMERAREREMEMEDDAGIDAGNNGGIDIGNDGGIDEGDAGGNDGGIDMGNDGGIEVGDAGGNDVGIDMGNDGGIEVGDAGEDAGENGDM